MNHGDLRVLWKDSFSVGDDVIDAQHRGFFDEFNLVADALEAGLGREAVTRFYRRFVAGLSRHFRDEEDLMAAVRFPDIDLHRTEHQALMAAVTAIEDMLATAESVHDLHVVVKRLFCAMVEHLVAEDMRYKSHVLAAKGL